MRRLTRFLLCRLALIAFVTPLSSAGADEIADFYRGRTITIVVGHEVGTGFDLYGRVLARHLGSHIAGNPNVVVQNMVGASGIAAANWLYNIAPRDGTVLATFVPTAIFEPLFGNTAAKFDAARLTWIGNMDDGVSICGVSRSTGIERFEDLRVHETLFGSTGATGPLGRHALAVKHLLGARIKIVPGYPGSASVKLAMDRGEVGGICGLSMSSVTSQWREEFQSGAFRILLQLSGRPHPALAGIPHVNDFAKSPEDQQVFGLIFGIQALGRVFVSPPAMPPPRLQALREAFTATSRDSDFLAEAAKMQIDVNPAAGAEVESFIAAVAASSKQVIERARAATRND